MTRKDGSLPRFAPHARHGRWSWSGMYGLALPRRRHEIVFKNARKTARGCVHEDGNGKVCGPLAACNEPEVHFLSPCFYYRYRSISCFDGAVLTYLDLYIFRTTIPSTKLSLRQMPARVPRAGRLQKKGQPKLPHKNRCGNPPRRRAKVSEGQDRRDLRRADLRRGATCVCSREVVVEPSPCVKHRSFFMGNDIAANRISCKPQKLQGMSAIVKIGRDRWASGQASRMEEMAATPRSSHGTVVDRARRAPGESAGRGGSAPVGRLRGEDEQDQAVWLEPACPDGVPGMSGSGEWF